MNKKHIGIIAIASVVIICTASIGYIAYSGVWKDWVAGEWKGNHYDFWFYIESDEDLYNITLYLPLPMVKGEIASIVKDINNDSSKPSDWVCEYIDTEHGKMLKISADTITAGYHSIDMIYYVGHVINTENPVGNEPVLYPRINDTGATYKSYICANYNTSLATECKIYLEMRGGKSRGVLGATDCRGYRDILELVINGGSHEWYLVNGNLEIRR